jgi:hypothetical protein
MISEIELIWLIDKTVSLNNWEKRKLAEFIKLNPDKLDKVAKILKNEEKININIISKYFPNK